MTPSGRPVARAFTDMQQSGSGPGSTPGLSTSHDYAEGIGHIKARLAWRRAHCSTCATRKTLWLFEYYDSGRTYRKCVPCMTTEERKVVENFITLHLKG